MGGCQIAALGAVVPHLAFSLPYQEASGIGDADIDLVRYFEARYVFSWAGPLLGAVLDVFQRSAKLRSVVVRWQTV